MSEIAMNANFRALLRMQAYSPATDSVETIELGGYAVIPAEPSDERIQLEFGSKVITMGWFRLAKDGDRVFLTKDQVAVATGLHARHLAGFTCHLVPR